MGNAFPGWMAGPAASCWGANQAPGYLQLISFSPPAAHVCGGPCGQEKWGWYSRICSPELLQKYLHTSPCFSLTCSSWCAAGPAFCPRESSEGALSTQPQQCPSSHTVGVLVQNAWSADTPRVDVKLGMVLLTCKK